MHHHDSFKGAGQVFCVGCVCVVEWKVVEGHPSVSGTYGPYLSFISLWVAFE